MIFIEDNNVGGHRYISDEIGGGVLVWDTSLVSPKELATAVALELKNALTIDCSTTEREIELLCVCLTLLSHNRQLMEGKVPEDILRKYAKDFTPNSK